MSKRIANRVLLDVVHTMEQGILYFLNTVRIRIGMDADGNRLRFYLSDFLRD